MLKQPLCDKAPVCQKCGDPGFRELLIVCRQCKNSFEHMYCLFKFLKKGEKISFYCEECKPTIFPVYSPKELEVDTERSKVDLECNQTLKNQTTKGQGVSSISQLEKAPVCQKCGGTGFREVMIVCRQCKKSFEHKYCLFKFPKKGEKVRWYCEECKPTTFPVSSPKELEVDTERSKVDLECNQILQRQTTKSQGVSSISQLEKLQGKAKSTKSPFSDTDESKTSKKEIRPTLSNKDFIDQNEPHTSLTRSSPSTTFGETVHEVYVPETTVHINNSHQEIVVYNPESFLEKLKVDSERNKDDLQCSQEASQGVSSSAQLEKVQEAHNTKSPSSNVGENRTCNEEIRPILSNKDYIDENVQNTPLTVVSVPQAAVHTNNSHQEIAVHAPNSFDQTITYMARPFINCVWRGCISFGDDEFLPFRAHGSTIACQQVFDAANLLPSVFVMNKHLLSDIYQTLFKGCPPTDERIGLYIFPDGYARPERVLHLIDDIMEKDLVFVYTLDEVEMLVFSSHILPEEHQRFEGQYYLWSAFRKKQLPKSATPSNTYLVPTNGGKENSRDKREPKAINNILTESNKTAAKVEKTHTENKEKTYRNTLKGPIAESISGINKKHTRDEDGNRNSFEVSKNYNQEEKIAFSHSRLTKNQKLVKEAKRELVGNKKGIHANSSIGICTKHELADSLKKQSIVDFFAGSYVSDFYRKEKQKPAQEVVNESEKRVMDGNEIHSKGSAAEKQKPVHESKKRDMIRYETFASNAISFSLKKQKLSCTSIPGRKCTENQKLINKSKERRLKTPEETSKKLARGSESICDDALVNTCIQKSKYVEEKENRYGVDVDGNVASKQLPLEKIGKKLVYAWNEIASTPLLRGSPTPNNDCIRMPKSEVEKVENDKGDEDELKEGAVVDMEIEGNGEKDGSSDKDSNDHCLTLFPLQVEDMGIASKGGSATKLSLDLGLGGN